MLNAKLLKHFHRHIVPALMAACVGVGAAGPVQAREHPRAPFMMLVSIDGLKPEAILDAEHHGLRVPNLRALVSQGTHADAVRGVLPTLTYPSHMTLMTGVSPSKHGIYANTTFDPLDRNERGWYWYAEDARVASLWDAAAAAHLRTANVYWPTSVGARIDFNLPQIWRSGTADDLKLQRALGTPGLEAALSATLGPYPGGMDETVADDETRARFAIRLLETRHPDFMTVYFTGLDTEEHASGPFSPASNAALEQIDVLIGQLRAAAETAAPRRATFCVVSDHGFAPVQHDVNLAAAFLAAGLFVVDGNRKITSWRAMPWQAGGMAAVMLANPEDAVVRRQVGELLQNLALEPANGIERIMSHDDISATGGFPDAAYLVLFKIGYEAGGAIVPPLVSAPSNLGMHGYSPDRPEMRSTFVLAGPGIPAGHSLGSIDMRQIAPTLAKILGVALPEAEVGPLKLR